MDMPITEDEIRNRVPVRHIYQPSKVGVLTGERIASVVLMAEVRWANQTEFVPAAALELFDISEDSSFESIVRSRRYERIESLRSLMTFEKLYGSLSNVIYSMQTAEIRFFAHQFVPVLKFVNAPLGRLLIADEVGLGKTIEAGLVWTECRARFKARRLLVICPPTLVPKWIRELQDRFSIEANFVDAKALLDKLRVLNNKALLNRSLWFPPITPFVLERLRKLNCSHGLTITVPMSGLRAMKQLSNGGHVLRSSALSWNGMERPSLISLYLTKRI
jgi:hypothetical protein